MKYTKNYHLPQWEETDRILMTDFNKLTLDLENALTAANTALQAAAETAQRGVQKAEAAQRTADQNRVVELGRLLLKNAIPGTFQIPDPKLYSEFRVLWVNSTPNPAWEVTMYINGDKSQNYFSGISSPTERSGITMNRAGKTAYFNSVREIADNRDSLIYVRTDNNESRGNGANFYQNATVYKLPWDKLKTILIEPQNHGAGNFSSLFVLYGVKL